MSSQLLPIPEEFYAFETGRPFSRCLMCEVNLLEGNRDYFIEKAIRNYPGQGVQDVVYEYAVCARCAEATSERMSTESLIRIHMYFSDHPEFMKKVADYEKNWPQIEGNPLPGSCLITGRPAAELEEYLIYGHFRGDKMVKSSMPYLFSGRVLDELNECLSQQTRDELDGIRDRLLGGPPELEELWKTRRPVFF